MYDIVPVTSPHATDCGATCLKMLLAFYGQDIPLEQLIDECKTRLIGCTAGDIKRAGNAHGLDIIVYKMDAEELVEQDRPAIILWMHNHFVVFAGKDEAGKICICNPDRGRYRVSFGVFKSFYSEVSIFNGVPGPVLQ